MSLRDLFCVVVLSTTTLLDAYSHRIRNNSTMPVRVLYLFAGVGQFRPNPTEHYLAPGEEKSMEGGPNSRINAMLVEYRGSDPRFSGLKARWTPIGSPPLSTITSIYTDPWPYDPDAETDSVGDPITPPANPKRHRQIHVAVQEFR